MFSTYDCAVKGYRQKEDPWNAIIAGFLTGGSLAIRSGPKSMFGSAVGTGILLGVFEGVGVLMGRMFAQPVPPVPRTSLCFPIGLCELTLCSSRTSTGLNTGTSLDSASHL